MATNKENGEDHNQLEAGVSEEISQSCKGKEGRKENEDEKKNKRKLTSPPTYTTQEYTDIVITYGMAGENASATSRLYAERFRNRMNHPSRRSIERLILRLRETGTFAPRRREHARELPLRKEEKLLRELEDDPTISLRRAAKSLGVSPYAVWKTKCDEELNPLD